MVFSLVVCVDIHLLCLSPQKIENGRFAKYRYFAHAKVNDSDFLMITKRRVKHNTPEYLNSVYPRSNPLLCGFFSRGIFFVTKGTFGQLTCEWQYLFEEFTKEPMIVESRRLRIEAKVREIFD